MDLFRTVVAGVLVFVGGQIVIRALIEPWLAYRELVGRIAHAVVLYSTANYGFSPAIGPSLPLVSPVPPDEAVRTYRSLSGELHQRTYGILGYDALAALRLMPSRQDVQVAASNLIGLSNSVGDLGDNRHERAVAIRKALGISELLAPPRRLSDRLRRTKRDDS